MSQDSKRRFSRYFGLHRSVQLEGKTGACYQHLETAKAHSGRAIWANRLRQLLLERMTKGTINMERNNVYLYQDFELLGQLRLGVGKHLLCLLVSCCAAVLASKINESGTLNCFDDDTMKTNHSSLGTQRGTHHDDKQRRMKYHRTDCGDSPRISTRWRRTTKNNDWS